MNKAAAYLIGTHDFASFCKVHTDVKTTLCDVKQAYWTVLSPTQAEFVITADRFLRNMVRAIVGTLLEVGRGKMTVQEFCQVIEKKDRCSAGMSVPGRGFFLSKIDYPDDIFLTDSLR